MIVSALKILVFHEVDICVFCRLSAYHAGLNNKVRTSVLDNWISSKIQVVVATVAFGYDRLLNSAVIGPFFVLFTLFLHLRIL